LMRQVLILLADVPDGRVFGLDRQTLISIGIQLFNACVLAAALGFILYKPVREFMQKRADRISGQLENAEKKMEEALELKAQYEKKLGEIDLERAHVLESARVAALERSKHIIDEAQHEAAALRQRTRESLEHERQRMEEEIRLQIIEVASLMASKFMARSMDAETQNRLFDEAMQELEEASWLH